jgi:hypothetical protein
MPAIALHQRERLGMLAGAFQAKSLCELGKFQAGVSFEDQYLALDLRRNR